MMKLDDVIREISVDLNDQVPGYEYTRWTVAQLQSYAREALTIVSQALKDLFTSTVIVRVQSGVAWQKVCEDCQYIQRIIGESDAAGNVLRYLRRLTDADENTWTGPVRTLCEGNPKNYVMTDYQTSGVNFDMFRVLPPVPPGITKYVLVECYARPDSANLTIDVPEDVVAMVKQWVLYRALVVDSENNPTITQLAQTHNKVFTELLGLAVAEREARRAENNIRTVQKSATQ